ncbi:Folate-binding protein YgfZ [Candidatus Trichorickettsia mobilis]|uniref:Folate-binding protein YgfZ n=1 Tax=Candidatus Trichorickettsia mobilis TaxID=1346319 RepID=A0ABZ0URC9_9RICK|nr:folate-binding protein [Candidatus Trichorickettsia mobilis]WPY00166.1 Folate-binding protein YgfZ [Candidatus Trichorickettsia mobilis]
MYEILTDRSILEVSGVDASKFLQNLITNDLTVNDYCYTYMLNNQGRYLFDFFIIKLSSEKFLIDISQTISAQFIEKLMMYKLRARVEFFNSSDKYSVIYSKNKPEFTTIFSSHDPRYQQLGIRSIVNKTVKFVPDAQLDLYLNDKYNFAIPDGDIDLIPGKSIPVEYGAEELGAISYDKGCYIGQEVISRTKYQGTVRKKIFKIQAKTDMNNQLKTNEIVSSSEVIGRVCSTYKTQGLALVREENYFACSNELITVDGIEIKLSIPEWR